MDKDTKAYRESEFQNISMRHPLYKAQIQITDNHGRTKWLSITDDELLAMKKILTGRNPDDVTVNALVDIQNHAQGKCEHFDTEECNTEILRLSNRALEKLEVR